ncbi:MAG: Holliday junction branch migration protein RuvA [Gorillibacterium sp.]|nr:Holliday junction branch migration protein RuvA [Gorillibacterium sp.]
MIDYLSGTLVHRENDFVVVDVGGVGYRVFCANAYGLETKEDTQIKLFIHYHVREDAVLLFGFISREEQSLFRRLLEVSGIGPRVAIGILSVGRPEAVIAAIYQEDLVFLTRLPGIGKKTAQRMVLDLKDKLADLSPGGLDSLAQAASTSPGGGASAGDGAWSEMCLALLALGYTEAEVDRVKPAVQKVAIGTESVDALLKLALTALLRG